MPETQPAAEFINGEISYKSIPQGEHNRLQYIVGRSPRRRPTLLGFGF